MIKEIAEEDGGGTSFPTVRVVPLDDDGRSPSCVVHNGEAVHLGIARTEANNCGVFAELALTTDGREWPVCTRHAGTVAAAMLRAPE